MILPENVLESEKIVISPEEDTSEGEEYFSAEEDEIMLEIHIKSDKKMKDVGTQTDLSFNQNCIIL